MANRNASNFWFWLLIAAAFAAGVILVGYFLFPQAVKQVTQWVVGLLLVVTGLIFKRKK
ncbi:MAG: hypothetical protein IPM98_10815 [Lewinellaceae bacterium]|nr:hypothetical protein [Lewinellaceae bacterium]